MARGKILIVDDEAEIVSFFQDYLEDLGFNVVVAENGEEGLETFRGDQFDLIISDMMMPKMIGLEFYRRVKEIKEDQKLIFITGVKEESMVQKAQKLGCHHYLTKPVTLADVDARLAEIFPEESS